MARAAKRGRRTQQATPAKPATDAESSRQRRRRRREEQRQEPGTGVRTALIQRRGWLLGGGVGVLAIVAIVASLVSGESVSGTFPITAYQGQAELGGEDVDFTDLLGQGRPVVLNFWAGDCPPCRAEMPAFQRMYEANRDELLLVGVDIGPFMRLGSHDDARDLLAELGITYPAAYARNSAPVRSFGVQSMPTTVFFRGDGTIASVHQGFLDESSLQSSVRSLLAFEP